MKVIPRCQGKKPLEVVVLILLAKVTTMDQKNVNEKTKRRKNPAVVNLQKAVRVLLPIILLMTLVVVVPVVVLKNQELVEMF